MGTEQRMASGSGDAVALDTRAIPNRLSGCIASRCRVRDLAASQDRGTQRHLECGTVGTCPQPRSDRTDESALATDDRAGDECYVGEDRAALWTNAWRKRTGRGIDGADSLSRGCHHSRTNDTDQGHVDK